MQAAEMSQRVAFAWGYIDKPPGEILVSILPISNLTFVDRWTSIPHFHCPEFTTSTT